ncbi:MAG: leucine-rich repeat domain-containing protein [Eubacterium sp.]|nr:leucine-rich repeat domain-containing protein [Eubacterium sp.]
MVKRYNGRLYTTALMVLIVIAVSITMMTAAAETAFAEGEPADGTALPNGEYTDAIQAVEASMFSHEPTTYIAHDPDGQELSGKCGDDVSYKIYGLITWERYDDPETGPHWSYSDYSSYLGVISGTGPTHDYEKDNVIDWSRVREVVVEEGVTSIGNNFFNILNEDNMLKKVTLPESLRSIGAYAFNNSEYLDTVNIPGSVGYIGDGAFYCCSSLEEITIPEGITAIEEYSFYGLKKIRSITIPDSVTEIGQYAFSSCSSLADVKWGKGLKKIGPCSFGGCAFTELEIPGQVTYIGRNAFEVCRKLKKVKISTSVTKIPKEAFYRCEKLTQVSFPSSSRVTVIDSGAFEGCKSLKTVTFPKKLKSIKDDTFLGCSKLSTIKLLGKKHPKLQSYCVFVLDRILSKKRTKKITFRCPNMSKVEKEKFIKYLKKDSIYFFGKVR